MLMLPSCYSVDKSGLSLKGSKGWMFHITASRSLLDVLLGHSEAQQPRNIPKVEKSSSLGAVLSLAGSGRAVAARCWECWIESWWEQQDLAG